MPAPYIQFELHPTKKLIDIEGFYTAFEAVYPKNFYFPGEMHDFWEMVYIYSGTATATGDAKIYNLEAGHLLFHKPMEFHRIWSNNKEDIRMAVISFKASGRGMKSFFDRCFNLNEAEKNEISVLHNAYYHALNVYDKHGEKSNEYRIASSKAAALFEGFLLKLINKTALDFEPKTQDEMNYYKIVEYMTDHCNENLSVGDISEGVCMSQSNVKRIFAKYSDVGIAKYFLNLKIRKAKHLLEEGLSGAQVADALNFNETNYFHTVFKRETGMTPKQYQKLKDV